MSLDTQPMNQDTSMSNDRLVKLTSDDGVEITVTLQVAKVSTLLKNMIEDIYTEPSMETISLDLPNLNGQVLKLALEFCEAHKNDDPEKIDEYTVPRSVISEWDQAFIKPINDLIPTQRPTLLSQLAIAANYLDIKKLLDLTCKTFAAGINHLTATTPDDQVVQRIRDEYGLVNDWAPGELEKVIEDNPWCCAE